MQQEIDYVNHVRDQALGDVQIFVYDIVNGSGGRTFTMNFSGTGDLEHLSKTLTFETNANFTNDERRKGLKEKIELGLLAYLIDGNYLDEIRISVKSKEKKEQKDVTDDNPWNNWVFEIFGEGEIESETSRGKYDLDFGVEGDRVTEDWRIRGDMLFSYAENRILRDDEEFLSVRQRSFLNGSIVRSLGSHWSAGVFSGINHSTYSNIDRAIHFRPAIEYNIFPYSEVLQREIVIAYKVGYIRNKYIEKTIFDMKEEDLFRQTFDVEMRFRQPWGDVYTNFEASTYLHDWSKNRLELYSRLSVRVYKGLSIRFRINVDLVRDQLNLPAGNASLEDVLLRQRQIATDFEFNTSVGFSYQFGSPYNNVINTRL